MPVHVNNNNNDLRRKDFAFGITNARSLWKKMEDLYVHINELNLHFAVITETWFTEGRDYENLVAEAKGRKGYGMISRSRKRRGRANIGGGVTIVFDRKKIDLREYKVKRADHEIVCATGKLRHNSRKIFVLAAYFSTRLRAAGLSEGAELLADAILKIKTEHTDPYIIICGDFNKVAMTDVTRDYPDMSTLPTGPTRGTSTLDVTSVNFSNELDHTKNTSALRTDDGLSQSDHTFVSHHFQLQHLHQFEWVKFKARKMTPAALDAFDEEIRLTRWDTVATSRKTIDARAAELHATLAGLLDKHCPFKTHRYRSTDDPWIDDAVRDMIRRRKEVFGREKRLSLIHI